MKIKLNTLFKDAVTIRAVNVFVASIATFLISVSAHALPTFARQTAQPCSSCHIGGFGPQLTPFGRQFKLGGYTMKIGNNSAPPISAMLVGIYDKTAKDLPEDAAPHYSNNDNLALQETSLFVAGRATEHIGGFIQATYSGIERKTGMDNLDIRYAQPTTLGDHNAIIGVSVNNNPTVQDTWNTVPAWRFPYMSADLAPGPNGSPLIAGGLEEQVIGLTTYVYWNEKVYAEAGLYKSQPASLLEHTHVIESAEDLSKISGVAPYWRLTYNNYFDAQNISVGIFGLQANILPGTNSGPKDKYNDVGIDASYQSMGTGRHIFTANASLIRESQQLNATFSGGDADRASNKNNSLNLNGSYYFNNTYGATLAYFNNGGSKEDATLFASNPVDGSRVGHSDANGYILQADYTPFGKGGSTLTNVRLGLQYTLYNKFNGASKNYDGFGRNASDNNTLMLMVWAAI
jgi:hypothetical protein